MSTSEIRMYDALKNSLGEEQARTFIGAHNDNVTTKFEVMMKDLATKDDLKEVRAELKADIKELRTEFHEFKSEMYQFKSEMYEFKLEMREFKSEMREFKSEMKGDFAKLREELGEKIHKATMVQTITIIGSILAIIFMKSL